MQHPAELTDGAAQQAVTDVLALPDGGQEFGLSDEPLRVFHQIPQQRPGFGA
jgi:hypothetical protein